MDILFLGQIAGACVAIGTALALGTKWLVLKPIKSYIDHATYPISPIANGGMALPDAIRSINEIKELLHDHIEKHDTPLN
jgi:hypothetical protein